MTPAQFLELLAAYLEAGNATMEGADKAERRRLVDVHDKAEAALQRLDPGEIRAQAAALAEVQEKADQAQAVVDEMGVQVEFARQGWDAAKAGLERVRQFCDALLEQAARRQAESNHQPSNSRTQIHFEALAEADRTTAIALRTALKGATNAD